MIKLKGPFTVLFQKVWTSGEMPHSWKVGLIKLLPKVPSPSSFAQWRPISLMGGMYKIFAKVMANRLHKVLPSVGQSPRNSVSLPVALGLLPAKVGECRN